MAEPPSRETRHVIEMDIPGERIIELEGRSIQMTEIHIKKKEKAIRDRTEQPRIVGQYKML